MGTEADVQDLFLDADPFVAGEWRGGSGSEVVSRHAADGSVNRRLRLSSVDQADEALEAAHVAFVDGGWAGSLPAERASVLHAISDGILENIDRLSWIEARNTGKTHEETRALTQSAAATFRYYAGLLDTADEELTVPRGECLSLSRYKALGVIGAITPWNSPIANDAQKVAPALAAGNSVVLKPSTWAPLTALELATVAQESGLPGLLNVLPGTGRDVGHRIVEHPDTKKVSLTGSTSAGMSVAAATANKLMPVSLKLGDKSPVAVFADSDRAAAIAGVVYGIFGSSGKSCITGSRLFVEASIYDEFVEELVPVTRELRVGDPTDAFTQVGPLITEEYRASVEKYIRLAVERAVGSWWAGPGPRTRASRRAITTSPRPSRMRPLTRRSVARRSSGLFSWTRPSRARTISSRVPTIRRMDWPGGLGPATIGGPCGAHRHWCRLGQHLQAVHHLHALRRREDEWAGTGEGTRRDPQLHAAAERLLVPVRGSHPVNM